MLPKEIIDCIFLYENPYKNYYNEYIITKIKKLPPYCGTYRGYAHGVKADIIKYMRNNKEKILHKNLLYDDKWVFSEPPEPCKTYSKILLEYVKNTFLE